MVDFARIQNRIYYGYGKAAFRLGTAHDIYRSASAINPIQANNLFKNIKVSIDQNLTYKTTSKYNDPAWQFLPEDGLTLQPYDFMTGAGNTYFIADIAPYARLTPPLCIECNTTISIDATGHTLSEGLNSYQELAPLTRIVENCPVSFLEYTRAGSDNMKLPTSGKMPYYNIIMPGFDGLEVDTGYIITEGNRRLTVLTAELSNKSLGLRIMAIQQGA